MGDPVSFVIVALTVCASIHYAVVTWFAWRFCRRGPPLSGSTPPLSVLKPLHGADPSLEANLRTHASQDYPEFELLCGVESSADPAVAVVNRVVAEFPDRRIETVVCGPAPSGNAKVWRLEELARRARHDVFLVNDADIAVEPGYFREVVAELDDSSVGLVSCLYRARPGAGAASVLEALWVSAGVPGIGARRGGSKGCGSRSARRWRFGAPTFATLVVSRPCALSWPMITNWDSAWPRESGASWAGEQSKPFCRTGVGAT